NGFIVEIHKKFAIPTACFVFAVLGVPLGIRAHRAGRWAAFVALLPVVLFYYVFLTLGEQMANTGRIPPWVAMCGPNLVVAVIGLSLLWSNLKERPIPVVVAAQRLFWVAAALVKAVRSGEGRRLARREALQRRRLAPALRGARRRATSPLPRRVR